MKQYVWYSPEYDIVYVDSKDVGCVFKDEHGSFHKMYFLANNEYLVEPFKPIDFYLVGDYE